VTKTRHRELTGEQEQTIYTIMSAANRELREEVRDGLIKHEKLLAFLAQPKRIQTAKLRQALLTMFD